MEAPHRAALFCVALAALFYLHSIRSGVGTTLDALSSVSLKLGKLDREVAGGLSAARAGIVENVPATFAPTNCTAGSPLSYAAPRYFPFPPFRVVLETAAGTCDLASPVGTDAAKRHEYCAAFERGDLMMPEPFVVQAIGSFLGHCPSAATPCRFIDIGGNLGIHTAFMASLGAYGDAVEPQAEMAAAIKATMDANCWGGKVRVHNKGITPNDEESGKKVEFGGGWRLADRAMKHRQAEQMELLAIQPLLRGRRVDFLKIDIDNSVIEAQLLVAFSRMVVDGTADVGAVVIEVSTSSARSGRAGSITRALSVLQKHGYHAYRLPHHLHQMDKPERFYTPCISVRAFKFVLHVKTLSPQEWLELLLVKGDQKGRHDTLSLVLSKERIGVGAEAKWMSGSMEATLPAYWRDAKCGGADAEAAGAPHFE